MYYDHFGLDQPPFKITPDTRLFYEGGHRGEILNALLYAIESGEGMVKVVGEVGTGKTMLCRMLEVRLPETVEVVYLANPSLSPDEIVHAIAFELNLPISKETRRLEAMQALQDYLLERHAENRQVVLFVEEAQAMPLETLEEIRLLSNLETQQYKLLQIILFGQPELDENLALPHVRQLCERIIYNFNLAPFKGDEIGEYIDSRLRASGYRGPQLFRAEAVKAIAKASKGLTRRVNILADKCLLAAFAGGEHEVTAKHVRRAVEDSQFGVLQRRSPMRIVALSAAAGVAAAGIVGLAWWQIAGPGGLGATPVMPVAEPAFFPAPTTRAEPAVAPVVAVAGMQRAIEVESVPERPEVLAESSVIEGVTVVEPEQSVVAVEAPESEPELIGAAALVADAQSMESAAVGPAKVESVMLEQPVSSPVAEPQAAPAEVGDVVARETDAAATEVVEVMAMPETTGQPVVAATALNGLLGERFAATRAWLEGDRSGRYTIQILLTGDGSRDHLERFLTDARGAGEIESLYVYRTRLGGVPMIGVVFAEYPTLSAANRALARLRPAMKRGRPFVRNIRDIDLLMLSVRE